MKEMESAIKKVFQSSGSVAVLLSVITGGVGARFRRWQRAGSRW